MNILLLSLALQMNPGDGASNNNVKVEKKVIYKKETTVDLSGSEVKANSKLPPAFFVSKMNTPKGASLLQERLHNMKADKVNLLGF